jgi:hypothetical protein
VKIAIGVLLALGAACLAQGQMAEALRKGIVEEEVNRNFDAAAKEYSAAVSQYDKDRATAANALYRLAEAGRKRGKKTEASAAYSRLIREFSEQTQLVEKSRAYAPPAPMATAARDAEVAASRARIRAILVGHVQSAQAFADYVVLQYKLGAISDLETYDSKRNLARAQARLAAWDAGIVEPGQDNPLASPPPVRSLTQTANPPAQPKPPSPSPAQSKPAAPRDDANKQYRLSLQEKLKLAELNLQLIRKRYELGALGDHEVVVSQDKVNDAKLDLETFELKQLQSEPGKNAEVAAARARIRELLVSHVAAARSFADYMTKQYELGAIRESGTNLSKLVIAQAENRLKAWDAGVTAPAVGGSLAAPPPVAPKPAGGAAQRDGASTNQDFSQMLDEAVRLAQEEVSAKRRRYSEGLLDEISMKRASLDYDATLDELAALKGAGSLRADMPPSGGKEPQERRVEMLEELWKLEVSRQRAGASSEAAVQQALERLDEAKTAVAAIAEVKRGGPGGNAAGNYVKLLQSRLAREEAAYRDADNRRKLGAASEAELAALRLKIQVSRLSLMSWTGGTDGRQVK